MQQISEIKYIIQHVEGHFINLKYEPVKDFKGAFRFYTEEEALHFITTSHYRTSNPELYHIVPVKITYELEEASHEREYENLRASESSTERSA